MNKNILLIFASVATLITMGAGCAATTPTDKSGVVTSTATYIMPIKELGIALTFPLQYKDLAYEIKSLADGELAASLYSKDISKKEKKCNAGSVGTISRSKKAYIETDYDGSLYGGMNIKVGDYHFSIVAPQDTCTGDKEIQNELTARTSALFNASATIKALKSQANDTDSKKSLVNYYLNRAGFLNEKMPKDNSGINKEPKALGFKELATIPVTCPDSAGTPCEGNLLILAKDSPHAGTQEFYLGFTMGTGYLYYGPFTDDLQRIVSESKTIKSIKK